MINLPQDKLGNIRPEVLAALSEHCPDIAKQAIKIQEENREAQKPNLIKYLDMFKTVHPQMEKLKYLVKIVASHDDPVLLQGETGTGKEILAHALHGSREGRFIPVNCAGLPEHLIESELFGHVRGAFTGASSDRTGMMAAAEDGTLFLDEIGELPMALQAKLLRALQEKRIRRVGDNQEIEITCRLISATHHELLTRVKEGVFREDLYWRLSTVVLKTLPLRQRRGDILLLVRHLDSEEEIEDTEDFVKRIKPETDLPGNVRTLQQMVRRYILFRQMPNQDILEVR